jgi:hypothetical protein
MKNRCSIRLGTVLASVLALSALNVSGRAAEDTTATNPGFVPNTGQINSRAAPQPSSQSTDFANMPTPEEARAALIAPVSKQPSTGEAMTATTGSGAQAGTATEPPPSGPIGSFGQTIPAKFSHRNDVLDHVPIMATSLLLTDEQRKQIYDAVMADNSQLAAGADALKPTSELSPDQALNGMHPLPASVRSIEGINRLHYVKAKGKVLLIEPATRTVVDQITS